MCLNSLRPFLIIHCKLKCREKRFRSKCFYYLFTDEFYRTKTRNCIKFVWSKPTQWSRQLVNLRTRAKLACSCQSDSITQTMFKIKLYRSKFKNDTRDKFIIRTISKNIYLWIASWDSTKNLSTDEWRIKSNDELRGITQQ